MADSLRPPTPWEQWSRGELLFDLPIGLATAVIGIAGSLKFVFEEPPKLWIAATIGVAVLIVLVAHVWRAIERNRKARDKARVHALDGALHLLHVLLLEHIKSSQANVLRICVFVPADDRFSAVIQATDYVGTDKPYGRDRRLPAERGIVGKALRSQTAWFDSLPSGADLVTYLVGNYGFTREQAIDMQQDRRAWAAVPIQTEGQVVAVLYLDSSVPLAFGQKNGPRRRLIHGAILGVAQFLNRSYD